MKSLSSGASLLALALIALSVSCSGNDGNGSANAPDTQQSEVATAARAVAVPIISARTYVAGSAKVAVTGSFQINDSVAINTQASLSDGEMTWLQYGDSGSEAPNALVTVSHEEVGINVARGKLTATIGTADCTGDMDVTGSLITGHYKCQNVSSYDPSSGQMGTVDIEIDFTANS